VESFHGRLRDECLNVSSFWNLFDARRKISAWQREYNCERPHSALRYLTPEEFAQQWQLASPSRSLDREEEQAGQGNPAGSLRSALTCLPLCSQTTPTGRRSEKRNHDMISDTHLDGKWG